MHKLAASAVVSGLLLASCGHGGGSMSIPAFQAGATGQSPLGTHTVRRQSTTAMAAPDGWAATATQAITPANGTDAGALDPSRPIEVVLGLQIRNPDGLNAAIAAGQVMSRGAFVGTYAPTDQQVAAATSYLQSSGFTKIRAASNNMLVTATGSAAAVQKAFNTTLHSFTLPSGTYYANTTPAYIPPTLAGNVVAVLGLTNVPGIALTPQKKNVAPPPSPTPAPVASPTPSPSPTAPSNLKPTNCTKGVNTTTGTAVCPRFYDPASFNLAYDAGSTAPAFNTGIGIFTVGDPSVAIADLRDNERRYSLPSVPVNVIPVGAQSADTSGNGEWTLDMVSTHATAWQPQRLDLYNVGSFAFKDLTVAFNAWANDDKDPILNASVGGCEAFPYQSGDMVVGDMILAEAAAQGQTLFASTGDTGAYCGVAGVPPNGGVGGAPLVEYPAASPYAVAVGGTDLFSNVDGSYLGEDAWQSGGGGLSQFEYSPYWESPAQPVGTTPAGLTFRGLPDVAMDAGLETGALIWEGGVQYITGGTSLASPLAAGVWARMESLHGNALGFAPVVLYHTFNTSTPQQISGGPPPTQLIGPFHDVLSGTNGLYTALPKYDYTTGLGSLDIARLAAALK